MEAPVADTSISMAVVIWILVVVLALLLVFIYWRWVKRNSVVFWTWDDGCDDLYKRNRIDLDDVYFPKDFLWGTATAAHQIEGGITNNNWYQWENLPVSPVTGKPTIWNNEKSGMACDHWNRVTEDIGLMKKLGVGAYRFSVEWSRIEPVRGQINREALDHYHDELDQLRRAGLKPVLTIHHFSDPIWWNDLSGWEKEENLVYFVNFAKLLFTEYHEKVYMWCTINEPEVFVLGGWFGGHFPPGKRMSPLAGVVMKNLLEAHVQVYVALKSLPGGDTARIGIVKNYTQVDPLRDWHILDQIVAGQANKAFNVGILDFFLTGRFKFWMPGFQNVDHTNRFATKSNDFVGLNYYSHQSAAFQWSLKDPVLLTHREREKNIMTDMPYPIYAEGFHRAIMEMTKLGRPIYITENGVADERDDFRSLWIRRYFYAMSKAMREGADIRGFFYWSLYDNFEWSFGTSMRFGLYHNDFKTQKRTLRAGSMAFVNAVKKWSKNSSSEDDNSNEEELLF